MTAKECITGRRSIRQYTDQPVSHELLAQIVETASYAPSWKHTQIVRYNGKIMENAPMVVAVTVIKGRSGFERDGSFTTARGDAWQMFDAGVASEAFCLAAYDQGLGTVIIGIFDQQEAADLLEIPENQDLIALIPIGYSAEAPVAPKRTRNGSVILSTVILKSKSFPLRLFSGQGMSCPLPADPVSTRIIRKALYSYDVAYTSEYGFSYSVWLLCRK